MSEDQRETAFLRRLILYDGSDERRKLDQSIAQIKRDQRCVQRMAWMIALLLVLTLTGLAYGAIWDNNFPYNLSEVVFRVLCEVLLASLICLVGFAGFFMVHRSKLNRLREDCRRLVERFLESRLGNPHIAMLPGSERVSDDREAFQGPAACSSRPALAVET
jgi:hypothetical protein